MLVLDGWEQTQYRAATVHALDPDERMILIRAVPYDVEATVGEDLVESFAPGAFEHATKDPGRVKLWFGHSNAGGRIVGQGVDVADEPDGSLVRAHVSETHAGDELLTLARDGVLDEGSIEFTPIREWMNITRRGKLLVVRHKKATLRGVALVAHGAYGRNAAVLSVRDDTADARAKAVAFLQSLTS